VNTSCCAHGPEKKNPTRIWTLGVKNQKCVENRREREENVGEGWIRGDSMWHAPVVGGPFGIRQQKKKNSFIRQGSRATRNLRKKKTE